MYITNEIEVPERENETKLEGEKEVGGRSLLFDRYKRSSLIDTAVSWLCSE